MQQISGAGIETERAFGFSERPHWALQFFRKRAAKDFLAGAEA